MPSSSWKQARMMGRIVAEPEYAEERHVDPKVAKDFHDEDIEAGIFFDSNSVLIPEEESADANHRAKIYNQERKDRLNREAAENEERGMAQVQGGEGYAEGDPY